MNKEEITKILNKFDKVLENYEIDKKIGQLSVDSICHLFPSEMIVIKDYIKYLEQALLDIKSIVDLFEEYPSNAEVVHDISEVVNKAIGDKDE